MKKIWISRVIIPSAIMAILLLAPIVESLFSLGNETIFNFLASDSMYYMGIANNYLKYGIPTFDGTAPINGFHPLWETVLILIFKVFSVSHHNQVYATFALSVLFVCIAYVLMSSVFIKVLGTWTGIVATAVFFLGAYSVFFEPRRHFFSDPGLLYTFSPYSAINGMETPLSMALWAAFFASLISRYHAQTEGQKTKLDIQSVFPFSSRLLLPLIVLCRLDDVFLVAAITFFILLQKRFSLRDKANSLVKIFWITAIPVTLYVAYNYFTVGTLLPVSGTTKLSFSNIYASTLHLNLRAVLFPLPDNGWWWIYACRIYPLLFSFLVGIICIISGWKYKEIKTDEPSLRRYSFLFGWFVLFKSIFLLAFVPLLNQGYWYDFEIIAICNTIFAFAIGFFVKANHKATQIVLAVCLSIIIFRIPNEISFMKSSGTYSETEYSLWKNSDVIRTYLLGRDPKIKIIDNLDGAFVYLLDLPGDSITGLASSPDELRRRQKIGAWNSLVSRGVSVLPDHGYYDPKHLPPAGDNVRVAEEFHPPSSPVSFYRLELVDPAMPPTGKAVSLNASTRVTALASH
ncbi:hypothetical protein [Paraburkholderia saeva]|uniref:Uncharacterized protein n=1 Tax=Paraburkholderia saeva TaxID=2777537 RepID=A0A9N8WZM2_9BURK|nr:hypothetical protein [Paraburkholderia saeva]CAG4886628.1 hypothetical protein LMG31841_00230 [Paraburkholderia saeva]CAG4902096.1 hypothetical protein R52603_02930 [Paraburkholderia saeva]